MSQETLTVILEEQGPVVLPRRVRVSCLMEQGILWIQPAGYGNPVSAKGCPIRLELCRGRLRLIVYSDIGDEDPLLIDMEGAADPKLITCNWCGQAIQGPPVQWQTLPFCSSSCMDACRAVQ